MNSSDSVEQIIAPYLTTETVITQPLATLSALFFIYGIYVVIFGLAIHLLSHRNGHPLKLYMASTIGLFLLATIYAGNYAWGLSRQAIIEFNAVKSKEYTPFLKILALGIDFEATLWFAIGVSTSCFMNIIADSMLIHRCYMVWQSRIVLYLLAFVAFILNAISLGCVIAGLIGNFNMDVRLYQTASTISNATAIAIAFFQLVLALLTGGRIWWISVQATRLMERPTNTRYKSIAAIIIESGVIYAASLITLFVFQLLLDPDSTGIIPFDWAAVTTLVSGLAPTLIVVRVAYGMSVDSVEQVLLSTVRFAEGGSPGDSQRSGETRAYEQDLLDSEFPPGRIEKMV